MAKKSDGPKTYPLYILNGGKKWFTRFTAEQAARFANAPPPTQKQIEDMTTKLETAPKLGTNVDVDLPHGQRWRLNAKGEQD